MQMEQFTFLNANRYFKKKCKHCNKVSILLFCNIISKSDKVVLVCCYSWPCYVRTEPSSSLQCVLFEHLCALRIMGIKTTNLKIMQSIFYTLQILINPL